MRRRGADIVESFALKVKLVFQPHARTFRYLVNAVLAGSAGVNSLLVATRRIDWSFKPGSWQFDNFWTNYGWLVTTSLSIIIAFLWSIPNAGVFLVIAVVHSV